MGEDPVGALIGALLIGGGYLLLYGAIRNRKIFGRDGMLATALSTGDLNPDLVPRAYTPVSIGASVGDGGLIGVKGAQAHLAALRIGSVDAELGKEISDRLGLLRKGASTSEIEAIEQLLLLAEAKGKREEAETIHDYIGEVTT